MLESWGATDCDRKEFLSSGCQDEIEAEVSSEQTHSRRAQLQCGHEGGPSMRKDLSCVLICGFTAFT